MKQRTILFCFFLLFAASLALVLAFWTPIKLSFIEWSLKEYAQKTLGHELTIDKLLVKEKNRVQLEGITLKAPNSKEKSLTCNRADLRILFDWRSRKLDCRVVLHQPHISLPTLQEKAQSHFAKGFRGQRLLFQPQYKIQTTNGLLHLDGDKSASFSLRMQLAKTLEGDVRIGFEKDKEWLSLNFQQGKRSGIYTWSTEGIDAKNLADFCSLFDERCSLISIQKGKVFGAISHINEKGEWSVESAMVRATIPEILFNESGKKVTNFDLTLGVEKGVYLPKSRLTFFYDTLLGSILFKGKKSEDPLRVKVVGNLSALMERSGFHEWVRLKNPGQLVEIEALAKQEDNGFQVEGEVIVNRPGFKRDTWLLSGIFNLNTGSFERGDFASPAIVFNQYLTGFGKEDNFVRVQGGGAFSGSWDGEGIYFRWERGDFQLEHPFWLFSINRLRAGSRIAYLKGSRDWIGCFFLEDGSFYEKKSDITIRKIQSDLHLSTENTLEGRLEAILDHVPFRGYLSATFPDHHNVSKIELKEPVVEGDLSTGMRMLRYFYPSMPAFSLIPDSELILSSEDSYLQWTWEKQKMKCRANLVGKAVQQKEMQLFHGAKIEGLSFKFDVNCHENHFILSDLKGQLQIGKGKLAKTFNVFGDEIFFENKTKPYLHFDFWVGDRTRDYLRLKGETQAVRDRVTKVVFDKGATHYGKIYPKKFYFLLDEQLQIEKGELDFAFPVADLLQDMQDLAAMGFFHFDNADHIRTGSGMVNIALDLLPDRHGLDFQIDGKDLSMEEQTLGRFDVRGSISPGRWSIDHCQLDTLTFSAECHPFDQGIAIDFFGCRLGNTTMVGMDGKYLSKQKKLTANLNLVEFDLSRLVEFQSIPSIIPTLNLEGKLRANRGNLEVNFFQPNEIAAMDLTFLASLKDLKVDGIPFRDSENLQVKVQGGGITIKGQGAEDKRGHFFDKADYAFDRIYYHFHTGDLKLENFTLSLPERHYHSVENLFSKKTQLGRWKPFFYFLKESSGNEGLNTKISLSHYPYEETLELSFVEGIQFGPFFLNGLEVTERKSLLGMRAELNWSRKEIAKAVEFPLSLKKKFTRKELIHYFPEKVFVELEKEEENRFRIKQLHSLEDSSYLSLSLSDRFPSYITPFESVDAHLFIHPKSRIIKSEKYLMDIIGEWDRPAFSIRKFSSRKQQNR